MFSADKGTNRKPYVYNLLQHNQDHHHHHHRLYSPGSTVKHIKHGNKINMLWICTPGGKSSNLVWNTSYHTLYFSLLIQDSSDKSWDITSTRPRPSFKALSTSNRQRPSLKTPFSTRIGHDLLSKPFLQGVQLKSGPYFNMSNLFTKIYNMLYYTFNLYLQ